MSAFKLHTLKQKLWAIVAASFVGRVIVFFALPKTPSFLAPDEATYSSFAKWVADEKPLEEFPFFGSRLYYSGRSVILPATALIKLGLNELNAVRLTSSIYGFLSLCAVVYFCSKLLQLNKSRVMGNKKLERLVISLIVIYAFLPSHFVWSNLGLREAPNEFWLIMAFIGVFLLYREGQSKKFSFAALIFISIICTFSSRPQVGWVLVVTLLIYSILKIKNKVTYLLISSVLTGLFGGYLATTSSAYVTSDLYVAKESTPTPTKESTPTPINRGEVEASKLCNGSETTVKFESKIYNCIKSGKVTKRELSSNLAEVAINQVENIPGKQIVNQVGAASIIKRLACPWDENSDISKYGCLALRAPYMALTFLFRPLPFIDTTSYSSFFAATENVLWIFMLGLIAYSLLKTRKIAFLGKIAPSLIFFCLYVVGAGSYEGNMGTAFRHKSLILWVVLILVFATSKTMTTKENQKTKVTS